MDLGFFNRNTGNNTVITVLTPMQRVANELLNFQLQINEIKNTWAYSDYLWHPRPTLIAILEEKRDELKELANAFAKVGEIDEKKLKKFKTLSVSQQRIIQLSSNYFYAFYNALCVEPVHIFNSPIKTPPQQLIDGVVNALEAIQNELKTSRVMSVQP